MTQPEKFSCLIVDDEPLAREVLRRYIQQIPMLELTGECSNALQAATALKQQHVDLLFLDIQMPQISGMEQVRSLKQPPKIILTTAFEQYAVQAFELDVTDYLIKPILFERFLKAVMKAIPQQVLHAPMQPPLTQAEPANPAFLYFRADRKMVKVLLNDILYIESVKDYVKIYTTQGTVLTKHGISALEVMLPASFFLRTHRSYLVAINKIHSFTPEEITIQNKTIPISKLNRQQVLKVLTATNNL